MGKNLKGKECGKGISQRKDGWYTARFTDQWGCRKEKLFRTLPEARNWLEDARYADKRLGVFAPTDMTVDAWFDYWIEHVVGNRRPNTIRNYRERYKQNIQPVMGRIPLAELKPMHCQMVLNRMEKEWALCFVLRLITICCASTQWMLVCGSQNRFGHHEKSSI